MNAQQEQTPGEIVMEFLEEIGFLGALRKLALWIEKMEKRSKSK